MSKRFTFFGPVFRFGKYYGSIPEKDALVTEAETIGAATRNLDYKIKQYFDLPKDFKIQYDKSSIIVDEKYVSDDATDIELPPVCNYCGYRLNDAGDCPVCDYQEYDLLEGPAAMKLLSGLPE